MASAPEDVCAYLGNRSDKAYLGGCDVAVECTPDAARFLFVQRWWKGGLFDVAAGKVLGWAPDRMLLDSVTETAGMRVDGPAPERTVFMTLDNVAGVILTWMNDGDETVDVSYSISGKLSGQVESTSGRHGLTSEAYDQYVADTIYQALAVSSGAGELNWNGAAYQLMDSFVLAPGQSRNVVVTLGVSMTPDIAKAVRSWAEESAPLETNRVAWNSWFANNIPAFSCSDPEIEKLYYYRWWSMLTKMILSRVGHFRYSAPREGTMGYNAVISYSGIPAMDELRWMRKPDWVFDTAREFFDAENLADGHLTSAIFAHAIGNDNANSDTHGRAVPYHNYAVAALKDAMLIHPEAGESCVRELWPRLKRHLDSYYELFDIDGDGLYETYPNSDPSGQEWGMRFCYFDPIPELFRFRFDRGYQPDASTAEQDMAAVEWIRSFCYADPDTRWPETHEELLELYAKTCDHRLASLDQATHGYRDFEAAAELAALLGDEDAAGVYRAKAEKTRRGILEVMWNPADQFFYDVQPVTHKQAPVKSPTGYYAFWARVAGEAHNGMFEHLYDPKCFWTEYPIPTLPLDFPKYREVQEAGVDYWNYWTWPRTTCHAADGAMWAAKTFDEKRVPKAAELFRRYTQMHFLKGDINRPSIAERYDPHTAEPRMEWLDYNHSTWLDLVFKHIAGIEAADDNTLRIRPLDMGLDAFRFEGIPYRGHLVDVEWRKGDSGSERRPDSEAEARSMECNETIRSATDGPSPLPLPEGEGDSAADARRSPAKSAAGVLRVVVDGVVKVEREVLRDVDIRL